MADVAWSVLSGGSQVIRKSVVISASQTWTAPLALAGNTIYVTASAGGGGGETAAGTFYRRDGNGGEWCEKVPLIVTAGTGYAVVIGAGGATESSGGNTTFGSLLTLSGGSGGVAIDGSSWVTGMSTEKASVGTRGTIAIPVGSASGTMSWADPSITIPANLPPGKNENGSVEDSPRIYFVGNGPGYFGYTGANSGAGGPFNTAGFSGRVVIEWEEFL